MSTREFWVSVCALLIVAVMFVIPEPKRLSALDGTSLVIIWSTTVVWALGVPVVIIGYRQARLPLWAVTAYLVESTLLMAIGWVAMRW